MPSSTSLAAFIDMVEAGLHVEAIETWYHDEASMQENGMAPRSGRDALVRHEAAVLARARNVTSECLAPPLCDGDHVAIHWRFQFTWTDGSTTTLEEVALQEWRGEKVVRERFFYDSAQLQPTR